MKWKPMQWCGLVLAAAVLVAADAPGGDGAQKREFGPADQPTPRLDKNGQPNKGWMKHHDGLVEQAKAGGVDLYFEGDSITDFWTGKFNRRKVNGQKVWDKEFAGWHPGNFGISGDLTQHVLWRLENGELDGVTPKAIVLMIGTNNTGHGYPAEETAAGIKAVVEKLKEKEPQAKILLLAVFPRSAKADDKMRLTNDQVNAIISKEDFGPQVKYMDINSKFLEPDGTLTREIMPDLLHPSEKGYEIWADAIKPVLTEWLGAPEASKDMAPAGQAH